MARQLPRSIYIDALALVSSRKSGVGLTLQETLNGLSKNKAITDIYTIYLVVPLGKAKYLSNYLRPNVKIKTIYLPARVLELLLRLRLFPPADWLLGAGIYIFPNYRNWPLWRSRSLTYMYDVSFVRFPETVQPKNQRYLKQYVNRWISRADKIIAITQQVKEEIEIYLHVPDNQIEVAYCGVDREVFYERNSREISAIKEKYALAYENYLLFVGNIEPRKNLTALLAAYEKLSEDVREKYGLVIVGSDGWLNETFYDHLAKVQESGLKIFKVDKYVEDQDLPALYSGASALVHPAIYEGFGMTLLEAMACKTPVVVSDIPAIREVIEDRGYYFDPYDTDSIAQAIEHALEEINKPKQEKILLNALARSSEFSWEESAKQLVGVIENQFMAGPERRPLIKRIKFVYKGIDYKIRTSLGEKTLKPYRPQQAENKRDLKQILLTDFLREQPSRFKVLLLSLYLSIKHAAALVVKKAFKIVRRPNAQA